MRAKTFKAWTGIVVFFAGSGIFLPPVLMLISDKTTAAVMFGAGLVVAGLGFWLFYKNRDWEGGA